MNDVFVVKKDKLNKVRAYACVVSTFRVSNYACASKNNLFFYNTVIMFFELLC